MKSCIAVALLVATCNDDPLRGLLVDLAPAPAELSDAVEIAMGASLE